MDKWLYRQNARNKMEFGIHSPASKAFSKNGGESWDSFQSNSMRKNLIKDNIEVLKLMRTNDFREVLDKRNEKMKQFYKKES